MASSRILGLNENISTFGTAGNGRDYTSLATWEAATDVDLVTAEVSESLECYADAATLPGSVTLAGATTSDSYFRTIRSAPGEGHGGLVGVGAHISGTIATGTVVVSEANFKLHDITISTSASSSSAAWGIQVFNGALHAVGVIIAEVANAGSGSGLGAGVSSATAGTVFVNCLATGCKTSGFLLSNATSTHFYNCNAIDNGVNGFFRSNGDLVAVNCLATGNGTVDFITGIAAGSDYNASGDTSAQGDTTTRVSQTFTFIDDIGGDYHLDLADEGALGFGLDLSEDGVFPFDDDIDGDTIGVWSIGFDSQPAAEGTASGATFLILKRRRRKHGYN